MVMALGVSLVIAVALMFDVLAPGAVEAWKRFRARRRRVESFLIADPGRERRAEQRARELLRSCVNDEEWIMYRELGFIRVWSGRQAGGDGGEVAYLIYPHRPVVSFTASTGQPLHEYCVVFPDDPGPGTTPRLPSSDDVLAKWMALTGDERRLIGQANMHLPGRQIDPAQVSRDIWRLSRWEQARMRALPDQIAAEPPPSAAGEPRPAA
jgi:hypothetical protein